MSRIRAEVFAANDTHFALIEELELFVVARHGGYGDRSLLRTLAFL
jgi:hypothetical protein